MTLDQNLTKSKKFSFVVDRCALNEKVLKGNSIYLEIVELYRPKSD